MHGFKSSSLALLAALLQPAPLSARTYTVKSGDSLSKIAHKEGGGPVYGPQGSLKKILDLNPEVKNPDRIYPRQILVLSPEEVASEPQPSPADNDNALDSVPTDASAADAASAAAAANDSSATDAKAAEGPLFAVALQGFLAGTSLKVSAKDRSYKTELDSELKPGLQLQGFYFLNSRAALGLGLKLQETEYAATRDGRFEGREKVLKGFEALYQQRAGERFEFTLKAGTEQALFFVQEEASRFTLENAFVDFLRFELGYDLYQGETVVWSLGTGLSYEAAAETRSVDIDAGYSYGASTKLSYNLGSATFIEAGCFSERQIQDTALAKQKAWTSGLQLGLRKIY